MRVAVSPRSVGTRVGSNLVPILLAFGGTLLLLMLVDAPPLEALRLIWDGSFGSSARISNTFMTWVPIALTSAGLVVTFAAGLWNIGVEGQVMMGAIAATWVAREVPGGPEVLIPLTILAGIGGGAVWALLVGVLRTHGRVNEIFGGLGLTFVASGVAIYLIIGPWKRAGVGATTSGTDVFRQEAWFPTLTGSRLAPLALALASAAVIIVFTLMRGTLFGLRLRAVGRNYRSAFLLGIPTNRYMIGAFIICGALAGTAGTIQATGMHHKLVPAISGGYGFLGILVVLLSGFRAAWIAPVALFYAMISVGSTQLQLRLDLDSALGGVIQGILVLFVVLAGGWQRWRLHRRQATLPLEEAAEALPPEEASTAPPEPVTVHEEA